MIKEKKKRDFLFEILERYPAKIEAIPMPRHWKNVHGPWKPQTKKLDRKKAEVPDTIPFFQSWKKERATAKGRIGSTLGIVWNATLPTIPKEVKLTRSKKVLVLETCLVL